MTTYYAFRQSNQALVAAALRQVTGCRDTAPAPVVWQTMAQTPRVLATKLATSYHIAPSSDGWTLVYPNIDGTAPFAASLSRQSRGIVVAVVGQTYEAWDRGHPLLTPDDVPFGGFDPAAFAALQVPEATDWERWIHLWSPRWTPPPTDTE